MFRRGQHYSSVTLCKGSADVLKMFGMFTEIPNMALKLCDRSDQVFPPPLPHPRPLGRQNVGRGSAE